MSLSTNLMTKAMCYKKIVFAVVLAGFSLLATAQAPKVVEGVKEQMVRWQHLKPNSNFSVSVNQLDDANAPAYVKWKSTAPDTTTQHFISSIGLVSAEVDHSHYAHAGVASDYSFTLEVTHFDLNFNKTVENVVLRAQHDPNKNANQVLDKEVKVYYNTAHLQVKVLSIYDNQAAQTTTDPNDNFIIRGRIEAERYYDFDHSFKCSTAWDVATTFEYNAQHNTFILKRPTCTDDWDATEWELEWTYVDNYDGGSATRLVADSIDYNFSRNATRVRLPMSQSEYAISNVFEEGYVLVRMRYLGRKGSLFDQYYEGDWYPAQAAGTVNNHSQHLRVLVTPALAHEGTEKPWQYVASYAEEGKNKEVVSYYDGLNKNRQAVTRLSTDTLTVAGETIYDHQGRPAVQILPVPVNDKGILKFYDGINTNTAGNPYHADNFDGKNAEKLDSSVQGAAHYYSGSNAFSGVHQDYVPHANGYPFTQTQFTKDGTGRVRKQSGVGPDHAIGSGHEIQYFYSKPSQEMLVRLFGTEVGDVSHYKESIVIDANGQASVSYVDQHGRVIATSLAGEAPDNLQELDSHIDTATAEMLRRDLHLMNLPRLQGAAPTAYELTYPFYAVDTAEYSFWYEFQPEAYVLNCNSICFDCHYQLQITITNEAGDTIFDGDTLVQPAGSADLTNAQQSKLKFWAGDSLANSGFAQNLPKGKYTIHKRLVLDESHFEGYWNLYVQSDTSCLHSFDDYLNDAYAYTIDCDSVGIGVNEKDSLHDQCRQLYEDMLKDVSPGGQYGAYKLNGVYFGPEGEITKAQYESHYEEVSVFADANILSTAYNASATSATWKYPMSMYQTVDGDTAFVYLDSSQQRVRPEEVPANKFEKFIYNWQRSWAPSLIPFHPEYGAYDACRTFESSLFFDDGLLETESYAEALAAGYIGAGDEAILGEDSLYLLAVNGASDPNASSYHQGVYGDLQSELKEALNPKILGAAFSIKDKAASVACAQVNGSGKNCGNPKNFGDPNLSEEQLNRQWEAYRAAYLGNKRKVFENFIEAYAAEWSNNLVAYVHDTTGFSAEHTTTSTGGALLGDKQVRFGRTATILGVDIYSTDYTAVNNAAKDSVNAHTAAWKSSRCSSYIALWLEELSSCDLTQAYKDSIVAGFLEVCQAGYDENNPLGASTVPVATSNGYTSFEDVLVSVLGSTKAGNNYCNHLLISMPPAYNHPFRPGDALKKGDMDCGCEQLQSMAAEVETLSASSAECLEWEEYPAVNYAEGIAHLLNDLEGDSKLGNNRGTFVDLTGSAYDDTKTHLLPYLSNNVSDVFQAEVSVNNGNMMIHLRKKTDHSVAQNIVLYNYSIAYTGITFSEVVPARTSAEYYTTQKFEVKAKPTSGAAVQLKGYAPGLEHLLYVQPGTKRCIRKSITKSAIVSQIIAKTALDITEEEFYSLLYSCKNRGYSTDFYDFGADDSIYCSSTGGYLSQPEAYCDEYPYIDPIEKWFTRWMNEMAGHDGLGNNLNFGNTDSMDYGCGNPRSTTYLPDHFSTYRKVLEATYYPANNFEWDTSLPVGVPIKHVLWGGYIGYDCDPDYSQVCYVALGALDSATLDSFSTVDDIDSVFNYRYDASTNKYLVDVINKWGNKFTLETYNCRQEYCDNPKYTYSQLDGDGKAYGVNCDAVNKAPLLRFLNALTATSGAVDLLNTTGLNVSTYAGYKQDCNSLYRTSSLSIHDYIALNAPMSESPVMGDTLLARLGDTNQVPAYFTFYMTDTTVMDWDEIVGFEDLDYDTTELVEALKNGRSTYAATFYFTVKAKDANGATVLIKGHNTSYTMGNCFQVSIPNETEEIWLPASIRKMCPTCLSCDTVALALKDFYETHPNLGHNHQHHDKMLTSYLNTRYGNNWYSHEYQSFFDECELVDQVRGRRNACSYSFEISSGQRVAAYAAIVAYQDSLRDTTGYTFSFSRDSLSGGANAYCFNTWSLKKGMLPVVQAQLQSLYSSYSGSAASTDPLVGDTISIAWPRTAATGACRQNFRKLFIDTLALHFTAAHFDSTASFRNYKGAFAAQEWMTYSLEPRQLNVAQRHDLRQRIESLLAGCSGYEYRQPFYQYSAGENYRNDTLCTASSSGGTGCESCDDIRRTVRDFAPDKELSAQYGFEALLAAELRAKSQLNYQVVVKKDDCEDCNKEVVYVCTELSDEANALESFLHQRAKANKLANGAVLTDSLYAVAEFTQTSLYGAATLHQPIYSGQSISNDTLYIKLSDTNGFYSWIGLYGQAGEQVIFKNIGKFANLRTDPAKKGRNHRFLIDAYDSVTGNWKIVQGYTHLYTIAKCCELKQRKACYKPRYRQIEAERVPCDTIRNYQAHIIALRQYMDYLDQQKALFEAAYRDKCAEAFDSEVFQMSGPQLQHHFTLYYYDIAGNLVRTVPPQGAQLIASADYSSQGMENKARNWREKSFAQSKQDFADSPQLYELTEHELSTFYQYNTLNEVTRQLTPDGGESEFFYDRLGRLVFSQNAVQAERGHIYSYTRYDGLGRIHEVGEMALPNDILTDSLRNDTSYFLREYNKGVRSQITLTQYDAPLNTAANTAFGSAGQSYLRNRVAATYFVEAAGLPYSYASHYSYDVHGNVKTVLHEYAELEQYGQRYKRIDYEYDLVSGNVQQVCYQKGEPDQFYHKYEYDADNRITAALTSKDQILWEQDARYEYYLHGPLARVVLGENQVQGLDYAYTLHGWLKGVNSELLDKTRDIGSDGHSNYQVAQDAFGFSLGYYQGDYKSIGASKFMAQRGTTGFGGTTENKDLYNGNISHMASANRAMLEGGKGVLGMNYTYDQLNRIKSSESFVKTSNSSNTWAGVNDANIYSTSYNYDANGNIMNLERFGFHDADTLMDDLVYHYYPNSNQLKYVEDQAALADDYFSTKNGGVEDLNSGQKSSGNYFYDAIGNLVADHQEGIANIDWTVYGKVSKVERADTMATPDLEFKYDASGNRIVKIVKPTASPITWKYTYYARDAQGNVMAVYNLQNGLEDSTHNVSLITDWLVEQYGLNAVTAMFNDEYATNASFLNGLIAEVESGGFSQTVMNAYTIDDLLNYDNNLAADLLRFYRHDTTDFYDVIDSLVGRHRSTIGNFYSYYSSTYEMIYHVLTRANGNQLLNCFSIVDLQQVYSGIYTSTPPGIKADLIDSLSGLDHDSTVLVAQGLSVPAFESKISSYYSSCISEWVFKRALGAGSFKSHNRILLEMTWLFSAAQLATFFTTDGDADVDRPMDLMKQYGTYSYILNVLADNDSENFIKNAIPFPHQQILDGTLEDLDWFNTTTYLQLVRENYGQAVTDDLLDDLGPLLIYCQKMRLAEHHIYGSSRLGMSQDSMALYNMRFKADSINSVDGSFYKSDTLGYYTASVDSLQAQRQLSLKKYELSNHLGNVLAVVSDKRTYLQDTTINGATVALWDAYIASAQDYYPFGMLMPNRVYSDTNQTQMLVRAITQYAHVAEIDTFTVGTAGWTGTSGGAVSQANKQLVVTADHENEGTLHNYTTTANQKYQLLLDLDHGDCDSIKVDILDSASTVIASYSNVATSLSYQFTAVNSETNVKVSRQDKNGQNINTFYLNSAVLSEIRDTFYQDTIYTATGNGYRYAFNGKEQDPEWNGVGAMYDYGFRIYDPRIAKFLSVDPLASSFPFYTPYQFSSNMPVAAVDLDGLEAAVMITGTWWVEQIQIAYDEGNEERVKQLVLKAHLTGLSNLTTDAAKVWAQNSGGWQDGSPAHSMNATEDGVAFYIPGPPGEPPLLVYHDPDALSYTLVDRMEDAVVYPFFLFERTLDKIKGTHKYNDKGSSPKSYKANAFDRWVIRNIDDEVLAEMASYWGSGTGAAGSGEAIIDDETRRLMEEEIMRRHQVTYDVWLEQLENQANSDGDDIREVLDEDNSQSVAIPQSRRGVTSQVTYKSKKYVDTFYYDENGEIIGVDTTDNEVDEKTYRSQRAIEFNNK